MTLEIGGGWCGGAHHIAAISSAPPLFHLNFIVFGCAVDRHKKMETESIRGHAAITSDLLGGKTSLPQQNSSGIGAPAPKAMSMLYNTNYVI